jgi:hypothetical protein
VQAINQYVSDSIKDAESDLKNQIAALRSQIGTPGKRSEIPPDALPKTKSKARPKKQQSKAEQAVAESEGEDYDNLSLRRLKAIGKERKLRGYARMKRPEILAALKQEEERWIGK